MTGGKKYQCYPTVLLDLSKSRVNRSDFESDKIRNNLNFYFNNEEGSLS